jgi:tetratricopeptide (TPR) repeat protein
MTAKTAVTGEPGGPLVVVLGLLAADAPGRVMGAPEDWPRWAVLLPHVLAATGHFKHFPGPQEQPGRHDASWLLDRAATYLQVHARLAEARPLAERALAITEAAYGPDHPDVAIRLNNLALIWRDLGEPGTARPLADRALAITEAAYGPDHPDVATRLNNLALIWQDLGKPGTARPLTERALAIDEAAYGPDHPDVGAALNNLATIWRDLGEPGTARPLTERALAITEAAYGPGHPTVGILRANLTALLHEIDHGASTAGGTSPEGHQPGRGAEGDPDGGP